MRSLCVLLVACGGGQAVPSNAVTVSGECRSDLRAHAREALLGDAGPDDLVEPAALGDLDGDGQADQVVMVQRPGETAYAVYVMRGACGHYAGALAGFGPTLASARTLGMVDLTTTDNGACEGARCGCTTGTRVYRWSGTAYTEDAAASTYAQENACPEEN